MPRRAEKLLKTDLEGLRKAAEAAAGLRKTLADAGQPGLYVQTARGQVHFLFRYRPPRGGGRRNLKIDRYPAITLDQARKIAQGLRAQVAGGVDPQDERERRAREAVTLAEAVEGYLADLRARAETGAARGKRSGYASARRRLGSHVVPKLGVTRLGEVTADQVRRLHRAMKETPVEANRTLTALSAVFGWADREALVPPGTNPTRHVERFAETGTRRALTGEELEALGKALSEAETTGGVELPVEVDGKTKTKRFPVHASAVLAVRLLALTGMRRSEVVGHTMKDRRGDREGLRWGDVDLDAATVTLHDSKTGRQVRTLGAAAVELLRQAEPESASDADPVVPGDVPGRPLVGIDKPRRRLWQAAGLDGVDLHSLRHSFASTGAHVQGGRYVGMVAPLLGHGHQARSITERYITSNPQALRPAADAIAGEVARLLGLAEPAQVVRHPSAAGGER